YDRTRVAAAADTLLTFRQRLVDAERRLPRDLPCVGIHRDQPTPWRTLAREVPDCPAARVLERRGEREVGSGSVHASAIVGLRRSCRCPAVVLTRLFRFHPTDHRRVVNVDENVPGPGIGRGSAPVDAARVTRELNRALGWCSLLVEQERGEWTGIVQAAALVPDLLTCRGMLDGRVVLTDHAFLFEVHSR